MASGELLMKGARVLIGDPRAKDVRPVDVRVADGVISEVGVDLDAGSAHVLDYSGCWIIPGFVDAHQHLWQAVLRGRLADVLHEGSSALVRELVANVVEPEDVYGGTYGGAIAQVDAGITTTLDHCDAVATLEHARAAVHALHDAGVRAVWAYDFDSVPHRGGSGQEQRLDDARSLEAMVTRHSLLSFGIAPSSDPDGDWLISQFGLADELGARVLTHTDLRDRPDGRFSSQVWLDEGLLSDSHIHASCSRTPAPMFAEFARLGCSVVSTPDVELGGGLGYTALRQSDDAGVVTALGTGSQAVVAPDMFATMRMGLQSERGRYQQAAAEASGTSGIAGITMRTEEILHFATLGGARALGLGDVCGSIETGKAADLVVIRPSSPRLTPVIDPIVGIVLHMGVADIDAVLVAGRFLKQDGALVGDSAARAMTELDAAHARMAQAAARTEGVPV